MLKGKHHTREAIEKIRNFRIGRHHSKETRTKMSASIRKACSVPEVKTRIRTAKIKLWQDPEYREKQSVAHKDTHHTKETRVKIAVANSIAQIGNKNALGWHHTKNARVNMSEAAQKRWLDPEYAKRVFRNASPNKAELKLEDILNRHFPGQWKFVGNKGVKLGELYPDFLNVNGKKQVIELFGAHWHDIFDIAKKRDSYRKYGFDVAIVWEDELKDEERLIKVFKKKFS